MKEGDKFTIPFVVSPDIYEGFMSVFRDRNPVHTDDEYAKKLGFSDRVMQGNILNGFLSYFIGECLPVKNVVIHSQSIKYAHPVYLNDGLMLTATVSGYYESVRVYEFSYSFTNQKSKAVAKGKIQIGVLI